MTRAFVFVSALLLCALLILFTGCFLKAHIDDGPGMVNVQGLLLQELAGDWISDGDGSYRIQIWDDATFSLRHNDELLIVCAALTLYPAGADTDEYSEFAISPNVFPDETGGSVEITKAGHGNGAITLELTASDAKKSVITFCKAAPGGPEILDGPGMVYYGGFLDEAISGLWSSADGRFILDLDGRYADFTVDGKQLVSKDNGYFVDHSFSENDDLNERCELYPTGNFTDDTDEPPFTISDMWYQAEHIYMNIVRPDGKTEEIVFSKA